MFAEIVSASPPAVNGCVRGPSGSLPGMPQTNRGKCHIFSFLNQETATGFMSLAEKAVEGLDSWHPCKQQLGNLIDVPWALRVENNNQHW